MTRRHRLQPTLLICLGLLLASEATPAQELTATYVEGSVVLEGHGPLGIGDALPSAALLLLGDSGYLEVVRRGRTVRLLGPGEYRLNELFATDGGDGGVASAVTGRVRRLIRAELRGDIAAAGVRGDFAGEDDWAGGPAVDLRLAADEALRAGRIESAQALYQEALLYAVGTETAIRLDLAELHLSRNELAKVIEVTEAIDTVDAMEPHLRGRYYLVRASALLELGDGERALELILDARRRRVSPAAAPLLELLAAESALSIGDHVAAAAALERVLDLAPDSPQGTAARRILAEM